MDAPKRKVTAKLTAPERPAATPSPNLQPATTQAVVRAKISGTARARTRTTSAVSAPVSHIPTNGSLHPAMGPSHAMARRSPSPSKMQQTNRPVRPTFSKAGGLAERTRHGSISSMLTMPTQSTNSAPTTPITQFPHRQNGDATHDHPSAAIVNAPNGSLRVKAKVTGLVKAKSASAAPSSSGIPPSLSTILSPPSPRARAPTISTTSHHRSASHSHTESYTPPPQFVPLPTSPPASAVSGSSHSSTSASSQSYATSVSTTPPLSTTHARTGSRSMSALPEDDGSAYPITPPIPPPPQRALVARVRPGTRITGGRGSVSGSGSVSLSAGGSASLEDEDHSENEETEDEDYDMHGQPHTEDPVIDEERAEAKSNRKIADLEITTRSLLAINASLEAAKVKQARELRDLRRRLRETRLILPPRAFRQLREADGSEHPEEPVEESEEEEDVVEEDGDETFARLRSLVEGLLDSGRKALAVACPTPHLARLDSTGGKGDATGEGSAVGRPEVLGWESGGKHGVAIGSRVLSPEEAGFWAGEGGDHERDQERDDTPVGFARDNPDEQPTSDSAES